jgi:predicted nuclease of predicted toxin-antitoxin system
MRIVADENLAYRMIKALRNEGFEVLSIEEDTPSIPDDNVLSVAVKEDALLITEDKDFGDLVMLHKLPHRGILLIRLAGVETDEKVIRTLEVIRTYGEELQGSFTVLDARRVRLRKKIAYSQVFDYKKSVRRLWLLDAFLMLNYHFTLLFLKWTLKIAK